MTTAAAPTAPALVPTAAPSFDKNAGKLTDRIVADIPDDFDLGDGPEPSPDTSKPTSLEEDDFDDDDGGEPTKPETPAPKKKEKEAEKPKAPPKPKEEPEPAAEEPKAAKSVLPDDKGTEDAPYTVKDLPEDRYVRIKVEGEEQTLTMRQLADGAIMKRTMDRNLSIAKQAVADTERIAASHLEFRKKLYNDFHEFWQNPQRVFGYMIQNLDPEMVLAVGEQIGNQYGEWQKNPELLQRHRAQREQRARDAEIKRREEEFQRREQALAQREANERTNQVWAPIWKDALKAAGFPENTPKFQRTVKALVKVAQDENGGKLTAEMFKECVVEAAKLSKAKTVEQRQPPEQPAPAPKPRAPKAEAEPAAVSHARKFRDPNFLLR